MSRKIKEIILSILSSRRKLTYLILIATLIIVIPVLATYTGPNRTVDEWQCHKEMVITGCYYTMPAEDEFHLNCKVASTYPGCPHPAADFFAGCDGNSQLHYIQEEQEFCKWVAVPAPPATVSGNVSCTNGSNGWCRSDATLNITGVDPIYSIIAIEGTRNGTDFACASDTCQINATGNGSFAFEYWAVSSHGDTSYKENTTISVDKENPEINLSVSGSIGHNNWYVSNVNWSTTVTDNISGPSHADITLDGSAQANPGSYGADGTHTIQATGYDIAGNNVQTQQTVSIDQTNPIPTYALSGSLGSNNWYISDVAWTGTATDATSGINAIQVQVDGGVVNNPASIAANGSHTIQVTAQDLAGNIASTSGSFQIDQEMPTLNLNLSGTAGQNGWYISPVSWTSSASDAVSGLSSHTLTLNSAPTAADGITRSDGTYTLNAIAQDNASNQTTQTKNFGIDQTAPTVSFSPLSGTYSDSVALSGSSADDTSGVAYIEIQVAGQTHQVPATGDWSLNWNTKSTCNGDVTATVRAFDQAGHASAPQNQSFTIHNQSVKITLPSQIDASQPVPLGINPSNISRMTVRITDDAGKLPAISQTYTGASIPSNYQWDRYMGDGSLAPKGTYTLNVLIQDKNTCVEDAASITLVVSDSKFSAWVSGAPTNTPAPIYPTFTPLPSPTPTLESTTTQPAIAANTSAPSATEAPTNTPTPVVVAFLSPKAEQKTTTTTNNSPKAPTSTSGGATDDTASTLPTGTLIGSAATGLIGSIAAYQAAKEAERKRREEEARKRAEELMHQRNKLIKEGIDPIGMNTKEISKLTEKIDKANKARDAYIYNSVIASGGDPDMSIEDARAIFTNSSIKKNDGENLTEQDINKRVDYAIDYQEKMRKQEEALAEFMAIEIAKEEYRLEQEAKQLKELENQNQNTKDRGRVITKPLSKGKQAQIDALEQRDDFNHEYYEKKIDKGSEAYQQGEATAINIALETFRKKQQRKNNQANPVSAGKQAQIDALEQRNDYNANSIDYGQEMANQFKQAQREVINQKAKEEAEKNTRKMEQKKGAAEETTDENSITSLVSWITGAKEVGASDIRSGKVTTATEEVNIRNKDEDNKNNKSGFLCNTFPWMPWCKVVKDETTQNPTQDLPTSTPTVIQSTSSPEDSIPYGGYTYIPAFGGVYVKDIENILDTFIFNPKITVLSGSDGINLYNVGPLPQNQIPKYLVTPFNDKVYPIQYLGVSPDKDIVGKREQANSIPKDTEVIIGYSAGADAAIMYAYENIDSIKAMIMFSPSFSGEIPDNFTGPSSLISNTDKYGLSTEFIEDYLQPLLEANIRIVWVADTNEFDTIGKQLG